jgi:fructose-1-phosphate kinase PfkB-like protein
VNPKSWGDREMIYAITLYPALDRTLWVKRIQPDESNRLEKEEWKVDHGKGKSEPTKQ